MQHQPVCPDILPNWSSSFSARAARCWLKNLKIFVQIGGWCSTAAHTHTAQTYSSAATNAIIGKFMSRHLKNFNVSMYTDLSKRTSSQTMTLMVAGNVCPHDRIFTFWFKYCKRRGWCFWYQHGRASSLRVGIGTIRLVYVSPVGVDGKDLKKKKEERGAEVQMGYCVNLIWNNLCRYGGIVETPFRLTLNLQWALNVRGTFGTSSNSNAVASHIAVRSYIVAAKMSRLR